MCYQGMWDRAQVMIAVVAVGTAALMMARASRLGRRPVDGLVSDRCPAVGPVGGCCPVGGLASGRRLVLRRGLFFITVLPAICSSAVPRTGRLV
ncbi:hypothetical protein Kpho02_67930 [Kitasatospora phosalacinea]|uniref:Uncharacterized protein n=1 Tax=Kitasatospora phosalacinea TaxID=2065 RepID=A0A9W6V6T2_9ACTN|nr:hypothetical protein Kpho02_67930 [Kitasatospora phosalacinea]